LLIESKFIFANEHAGNLGSENDRNIGKHFQKIAK
jgi:ABC-type lipoprotein export system ATPase subunit